MAVSGQNRATADPTGNKRSAQVQRRTFVLLVSMFIGVQVVILALAFGALTLTNQIRAYTTGEGLYAKGQKQAVYALQRYAASSDPADFADYQDRIRVPLGDRQARIALQSEPPDREAAREGFLQGRDHPDDVPGMISIFLLLQDTPLMAPAIDVWRRADAVNEQLVARAAALREAVRADGASETRRRQILDDIQALDREVTALQDEFSRILGDRARQIGTAAFVLLGTASVILWIACLAFGINLHRRSVAAEIALAQREERTRALMDSTADGIVSVGPDGRIDAANRAAGRMVGCDAGELTGQPVEDLVAESDRRLFVDAMRVGNGVDVYTDHVFQGRRTDGSEFPMEVAVTRQAGAAEYRQIVTLRDVSERAATEARLFQAQKMEAVGQLTGGVAHDFNNLLTVITGNLEVLQSEVARPGSDEQADRLIRSALRAAERGAQLTAHLLAFSRRQPLTPLPVDVDDLIAGMNDLLRQTLTSAVDLQYRLESGGWRAMVDPVQLEAAVLNLTINARHALEGGGRVVVASRPFTARLQPELQDGEYVVVSISDNGTGIAPEHRERVFEPFFTTRTVGAGSGLGLSMVHGFVKQTGGKVQLASEVNEGTTVEMFLPRAVESLRQGASEVVEQPARAAGRVLVVEDDPAVLAIAVRMLEGHGYDVASAKDAVIGLELLEQEPPPDLVLSDVVLPEGMDGYAFASQVRRNYPDITVLLMSGYPRDAFPGGASGEFRLLQKPFRRGDLLRAVAEALSARAKS
ncbi:MAG: ATP-binding protein [Woeseiaceae bacterium]|nr:ATP-binding protein [Woeseiaceae bacterium]